MKFEILGALILLFICGFGMFFLRWRQLYASSKPSAPDKLCVNCQHYLFLDVKDARNYNDLYSGEYCKRTHKIIHDPVNGKITQKFNHCSSERGYYYPSGCSPRAKYFQKKVI